ncbi:MAG: carbohydrate binding domain-containing protein [Planctomycetia bacterium]|nr:carbohydrate binding domain-containing protein [Planctomycetia bacterium]
MKKNLFYICFLIILSGLVYGADHPDYPDMIRNIESKGNFDPLFPFQIELGSPQNLTNVQTWNSKEKAPDSFLKAENGRFVNGKGEVCRFFGTNICFSGCFPEHRDAEEVSRSLARFGINIVRLHYVHHKFPPNKKYSSPDSFIDPIQLERFDYFISRLKKEGISVYLTLNIARKFGEISGFENTDQLPKFNNGLDQFEARMIRLQKKYVSDLMNHVNPYTGLAYKNDPAIAMLEIANENSVVAVWFQKHLNDLPEPYCKDLQNRWNAWLLKKYGSDEKIHQSWEYEGRKIGEEWIPDSGLPEKIRSAKDSSWGFQQDLLSKSDWSVQPLEGSENFIRLQVQKKGKSDNIPQFYCQKFRVKKDEYYTVSFDLRSADTKKVSVRLSQNHDPWGVAGFRETVEAGPEWKHFKFAFKSPIDDDNVRIVFANFQIGTIDLARLSFRTGIDLPKDESLSDRSYAISDVKNFGLFPKRDHDFCTFLYDLEEAYFRTMFRYLKDEVKVSQPVCGTQLRYGYNRVQYEMDFCDIHNYWNHPVFPHKAWDANDWYLRNIALVNSGTAEHTLETLSMCRLLDRPFTVSEYDHPYPNLYCAEGNLLLSSFGAFQDWSGIFQFAWTHSTNYVRDSVSPMFDMCCNPAKLAHLPACRSIFVRGDVQSGPGHFVHAPLLTKEDEIENSANSRSQYHRRIKGVPSDQSLSNALYTGYDFSGGKFLADKKRISSWDELPGSLGNPDKKWIRNEFGEIFWNFQKENGGYVQIDTARTKAFTGFVCGRSFKYKGMNFQPGKTRLDWLTFSLVRTDGSVEKNDADLAPGDWLLAATGLIQNTGMIIRDLGEKNRISIAKDYGGSLGEHPILCEGIPAKLTFFGLAGKIKVYPLDGNGNEVGEVPVQSRDHDAVVEIHPKYRTIWYKICVQ